ncbi:FYVE, RhoGEF and PH domain containing 1 [Elysia marginata]|uniref:FYVE, RhoGEF and PH domain containing 1 n=1 Tax=Elysia marginata TaxID=1093978 RepID=A0AAV4IC84_9GAST|nr:FYVE, RhoGEF and PH domain containing 1 [Elysia marginata]
MNVNFFLSSGLTVLDPENAVRGAEGPLRLRSSSCREPLIDPYVLSECNHPASVRGATLPRRRSQPEQYLHPFSANTLGKVHNASYVQKRNKLPTDQSFGASTREDVDAVLRNYRPFYGSLRNVFYHHADPYGSHAPQPPSSLLTVQASQPPSRHLTLQPPPSYPATPSTSFPCQQERIIPNTTSSQLYNGNNQSRQPELIRHRENFWSSHGRVMAKGYVRAWADQINHHGPPASSDTGDEKEEGESVSVRALVKKLSQSNIEVECRAAASSSLKEMTSKVAQKPGALSPGALKKDVDSPQCVSGINNADIKDVLFQSVLKAADKKKMNTLDSSPSAEINSSELSSPTASYTQWQSKISPTLQKKNIQPGISQVLGQLNIDCSPVPNYKTSESLNSSPSHPHRNKSESPPWASHETSPPSPQSKASPPKSKPPVDYSRKPSLDITKKPLLSPKRPSLPSQDLISHGHSDNAGFQLKLSVFDGSASASSPLSSPQLSPSLCFNSPSSQGLVCENIQGVRDNACSKSNKLDSAADNEVFHPESKSSASASPQISITQATENGPGPNSGISNSTTLTPSQDSGLRLRSSPGRSFTNSDYTESVLKTIYDNGPPLSVAELFDSSWSDSDSFSNECGEENDEDELEEKTADTTIVDGVDSSHEDEAETETPVSSPVVKTEAEKKAELENKRRHIVQEMLKTERDYVARLHLLHHVFFFRLDKENRQQTFIPAETLTQMFSNIKSIYTFHHDFLLQQIEEKVESWDQDPRIGHILEKNAPFLKMYSQYIAGFDNAMKLIDQWTKKSSKFSNIIKTVQELPECGNLSLQHHMLEPIQRVPRYELLIKDYMKTLPEDSPDLNDAKGNLVNELLKNQNCLSTSQNES